MNLAERICLVLADEPKIRARDLAKRLSVTEMEVVASREGIGVFRLTADHTRLFAAFTALGSVMALTRNETAVHERKGVFGPLEGEGHVRLVLGADIDLRLFLSHWHSAWAVSEGGRNSIQVFDKHGDAVHKVYPEAASAFDEIAASLAEPAPVPVPSARPVRSQENADSSIDVVGFQAAWRALTDTHGFFPLLRQFGVARAQALRLAPPEMVDALPNDALTTVLTAAASWDTPVMVFVGNPGCIQIHSGPVKRIVPMHEWINVLDPDFNLHVRLDRIAACWRVRKPTSDGIVTALEVFDSDGELAVQLFGVRKPGVPQDPRWTDLIERVEGRQ